LISTQHRAAAIRVRGDLGVIRHGRPSTLFPPEIAVPSHRAR